MSTNLAVRLVPNAGWDQRILVFQCGELVTAFAVFTKRYVILIDTLVNASTARYMVETIQDAVTANRQLLVINTHADWDHCWGNSIFVGVDAVVPAPIIGHRLCRERLISDAARQTLRAKQQQNPELYADVRLVPPTVTFDELLTIDGDDLQLELIHLPGHTPDHIAVHIPALNTVFPGDSAELPLPFVDTAETLPQLRASLIRLRELHAATALYCHAPGISSPEVIDANIAYFDTLEQRCRHALTAAVVPCNLDQVRDIEALIGYELSDVPGYSRLEPDAAAFYRDAHHQAARAMLRYLQLSYR